jgi:DNA anti-recombination protein RmuC
VKSGTRTANDVRSRRKAGRRGTMMTSEEQKKAGNGSAAKKEAPAGADAKGGANLEKIRDILFGAQVDDFEKKFARLEERLLKETADSRAETKKRFDSLESFIRKEVESLADRLRGEQEERMEAGKDLSRELRETAKGLEKKLGSLDEQTTRSQRELRQQILDQSKALTEEIRTRIRESATALSKELKELRAEKTDRTALAGLFTEAAMRLTNESRSPGKP